MRIVRGLVFSLLAMTPADALAGAAAAPSPARAAQAPASALSGFHHDSAQDMFGYYMPTVDIRVGNWQLTDFALGPEDEFAKFERGVRDSTVYAPVMFEFADTASPQVENEMGGTNYSRTVRVLPAAYRIAGGRIAFAGTDPILGAVRFDGAVDPGALAAARSGSQADAVVLVGDLTIGHRRFKSVRFTWFGGD